ncbi:14278_t:CDS:2, partial [Acaulospora morrowiae]
MTYYTQIPQMTVPPAKEGPYEWRHGLFDCFGDCELCLLTYFFPCITYGRNKAKLTPDSGCASECLLWCCTSEFFGTWLIGSITRGEIRQERNIR